MKRLLFTDLFLICHNDKTARHVEFDRRVTLIKGANDAGKSSVIKSIYRCLAAEPPKTNPRWENAHVRALLKFTLDGDLFSSYFDGRGLYAIYDKRGRLLKASTKVTEGVGPFFADLFDFRLKMMSRKQKAVTPPPAYMLIPFYIDQDKGWQDVWSSFAKLGQITNWRKDVVEYHAGLRPNQYYTTKIKLAELETELIEPKARERALQELQKDLMRRLATAQFDIDVEQYKAEIEELLKECNDLREREEAYKHRMLELENMRAVVAAQADIVRRVERELRSDYQFAVDKLADHVDCPTCGAQYENSFAERFAIARDEDRCVQMRHELEEQLRALDSDIETERKRILKTAAEAATLQALLDKKQGDVTLQTLIENKGRQEMKALIDADLQKVSGGIGEIEAGIRNLTETLKKFENKAHRSRITGAYATSLARYADGLDVQGLPPDTFKRLDAAIRATGSDLPRAILAYTIAVLQVKSEFGSATWFPIVIDSPNQQDQDPENLHKMLVFLNEQLPNDSQLVLGLVDEGDVKFGGRTEFIEGKYHALRSEEYDAVNAVMRPLVQQI